MSSIILSVSLVEESVNLQLLIKVVIILAECMDAHLLFLSNIAEDFISKMPEVFIFLN